MAKKVLPIHFDPKERKMLELLAKRDKVSMAEVVRRMVRSAASAAIPTAAVERASLAALNQQR